MPAYPVFFKALMLPSVNRFVIALALLLPAASGQSVITTLAGTDWIFPSSGIKALDAPLGFIRGVAADADGNVYGGDCDNHLIFKIDPNGVLSIVAGNGVAGISADGPAAGSRLSCPSHLIVNRNGDLLFADSLRIRKVTRDGLLTTVAGGGSNTSEGAPALQASITVMGLTVDSSGNIYFSEFTDRVRKIGSDGLVRTIAGTGVRGFSGDGGPAIQAQFAGSEGIAVTADGTVLIADYINNRVRAVSPDGVIRTFAGSGATTGSNGDGGQATAAVLVQPHYLFVEPSGAVVVSVARGNIRRIAPNGVISTLMAGSNSPEELAADANGNIFFCDIGDLGIGKVDPSRRVTKIAGNNKWRRTPDTYNPLAAWLNRPYAVGVSPAGLLTFTDFFDLGTVRQINSAGSLVRLGGARNPQTNSPNALNQLIGGASQFVFDLAGNLIVAAPNIAAIGKITPSGAFSIVAGRTNSFGFSGDGGPATSAQLNRPAGVALNAAGEIIIADTDNNRIRKISAAGTISTIAGTGATGFSGDAGPALSAQLNRPASLVLDPAGNIFFSDSVNNRIRRISPDGNISTIAGIGQGGFSGDGGPAELARLNTPLGLAFDPNGNLLIADSRNNRIRAIGADATISTIAGNGARAFSGDGGSPLSATFDSPSGVAIDPAGRIYIADTGNDRVRVIIPTRPTFELSIVPSPTGLSEFRLTSSVPGLAYSAAAANAPWLSITPSSGTLPASLQLTANTAGLAPGTYSATVTVTVPFANPPTREGVATVTVQDVQPPKLSIGSQALAFNFQQGASPSSITLSLSNQGGGTINYTASASDWLSASPASGQISAGATASLNVTANAGSLAEGTYSNTLTISDGSTTARIPVTMSVTRPQGKLLISQAGLTFTAVQGGGAPTSQSFGILNEGAGELPYEAKATTLSGGNWLTLNNPSGRVNRPLQDIGFVEAVTNPANLTAGDYYAEIRITAPGINSPQLVTVLLKVLPAGSNPGPEVRPSGLIFIGPPGTAPPSEDVRVANLLNRDTTYASSSLTLDGAKWISHLPATASISPGEPRRIVVQPDFRGITPGIKRGVLTLVFDDGSVRNVSILSIVPATAPALNKNGERMASSCASPSLRSEFLSLPEGGAVTIGQPVSIEVKVADECGNLLLGNEKNTNSAVYAKFSNGDPDLRLVPIGNGVWSNTWRPANASAGTVIVSAVSVFVQGLNLQAGRSDRGVRLSSGANVPIVRQGALVHSASQKGDVPIAPGTLVTIYGSDLAGAPRSTSVPLPTDVDGTQILLGGQALPILYSSATQINAQVPYTLPVNTAHQVVVRRGVTLSVPESFTVASAQPGIFTTNQQGTGQGVVMGSDQITIAMPAAPAERGKAIVIYCTGLGAVTPGVTLGIPAPSATLSRTVSPVSVEIGGKPAQVFFSGLTPGFTGLYQVNALVPVDAPTGDNVNLSILTEGQSSNTVTIAVK